MKDRKDQILDGCIITTLIVARFIVSSRTYEGLLCIASLILFIFETYRFVSVKRAKNIIDKRALVSMIITMLLFISILVFLIWDIKIYNIQ